MSSSRHSLRVGCVRTSCGWTLSDYHLVVPEVVAEAVLERCEIVPKGSEPSPVSVRDPDDELVLAGALAGGAQILISGDADLLSVAAQSPIPILSPRAFMTLTRGGAP